MKKLMALAAVLSLGMTAPAYADGTGTPFYLEAGVGQSSTHYNSYSQNAVNQGVIDGSTTALSLVAGAGLNDNFAVEFGYHDYGKPTTAQQTGLTVSQCPKSFSCPHISAVTLEAVGRFPIITTSPARCWVVSRPGASAARATP